MPLTPREREKLRHRDEAHSRRCILDVLSMSLDNDTDGWCSAQYVLDVLHAFIDQRAAPPADSYRRLLRELKLAGYLEEDDQRESPDDAVTHHSMQLRITADGVMLLNRTIPANPLVADIRLKL